MPLDPISNKTEINTDFPVEPPQPTSFHEALIFSNEGKNLELSQNIKVFQQQDFLNNAKNKILDQKFKDGLMQLQ